VVDDDVVVVPVVVVVVDGVHTVMLTVLPYETWVPDVGDCPSTAPGEAAPPEHPESGLKNALSP